MRMSLDFLPINGRVVFGSVDDAGGLTPGAIVGSGGKDVDLALDPLEGHGVVARGGNGAMSMIAVGEPGKFTTLPDIYMRKMAVGPRARGSIDLLRPVGENIEAIAEAFGRRVNDVTTIILDRPRHHDLIEEIRNVERAHQAHPGRRRHRGDLGCDPRHERPPRDRDRRHAAGGALRRRAALSRRRAAGAVLADVAPRDRRAARGGIEDYERVFRDGGSRAGRGDRRRDGRLERRPAPRRPLPRRQRPHALARHVHTLQLGALRRRDPLLRARTPRRSASSLNYAPGLPSRYCTKLARRRHGWRGMLLLPRGWVGAWDGVEEPGLMSRSRGAVPDTDQTV